MAGKVTITFKGTHLHVQTAGVREYRDRLDSWRQVVSACEEHQCFNILGESDPNLRPLETMEAHDTYKVLNEAGVTRKHRIAWIVDNPTKIESMLFAETVLKNRTFTGARVFTDATSAKRWLLNTRET